MPGVGTEPLLPDDPVELGGCLLLGRLGSGGMGTVYLGRDRAGQPVAVKVIRPELASQPEFRRRFRSEVGTPKVIDFGIARAFEATSNHTRAHEMVGTLAYMAPERFEEEESGTGPAADVFSWGVLITYAGTGRTPFECDSPAGTIARILAQPPDLGDLPAPLREIVARTLAKDPADRPTAAQLLDLLLATGPRGAPSRPVPADPPEDRADGVRRTGRRRGRGLVAAAAVTGLAGVLGAWALIDPEDATQPLSSPTAASRSPETRELALLLNDRLDKPDH